MESIKRRGLPTLAPTAPLPLMQRKAQTDHLRHECPREDLAAGRGMAHLIGVAPAALADQSNLARLRLATPVNQENDE
jgi:hypothetical protein